MRRQFTSFALMVCGVIALALGMTVAPAATPAAAMPGLQPSPRPTLIPTADVIPSNDKKDPTPVPFGRITGTVIDARTGAPAPGKRVVVGDTTVVSDGSGNYDHWVAPGAYAVGLQLREGEGVASQGMQALNVEPASTNVLHLFFTSPAPEPTAAPVAVAPAAEPTLEPAPAMQLPDEIPDTSVAKSSPAALPETAAGGSGAPVAFVLMGALLFGAGALLQLRPRRRAARAAQADGRMLRRMLASTPRPSAEETLDALLRRDPQE